MKTHLIFNVADKPNNMGPMHMIEDMEQWLEDRKNILKDAIISKDNTQLTFIKQDGEEGSAMLYQVPNDFMCY